MSIRTATVPDDVSRALDAGIAGLARSGALTGPWASLAEGELEAAGPFALYAATASELQHDGLAGARLIGYRWLLLRREEAVAAVDLQRTAGGTFALAAMFDQPVASAALDALAGAGDGAGEWEARFLLVPDLGLSLQWLAGTPHRLVAQDGTGIDEEELTRRARAAGAPPPSGRRLPRVLRGVPLAPAATVAVTGQPQTKVLNFLIQSQQMANWCWAAVTSSVYMYFTGDVDKWPQCIVVNTLLSQTACCETPWIATCDQPGSTWAALARVGCLNIGLTRAASQNEMEGWINAGSPIGVGISSAGSGHAVTIYGYTQTGGPNDVIYIGDPWPTMGYSAMNFNNFPASYGSGGSWIQTWVTQAP